LTFRFSSGWIAENDMANLSHVEVVIAVTELCNRAELLKNSIERVSDEVWADLTKYHQWALVHGLHPAYLAEAYPQTNAVHSWQQVLHHCGAILKALE
jgi:hypothetical protein